MSCVFFSFFLSYSSFLLCSYHSTAKKIVLIICTLQSAPHLLILRSEFICIYNYSGNTPAATTVHTTTLWSTHSIFSAHTITTPGEIPVAAKHYHHYYFLTTQLIFFLCTHLAFSRHSLPSSSSLVALNYIKLIFIYTLLLMHNITVMLALYLQYICLVSSLPQMLGSTRQV